MDKQKQRYLLAKLSTEKYKLNPEYLTEEQRSNLDNEVEKLNQLQKSIMASVEATKVRVSAAEVVEAYLKCAEKFESEEELYLVLKKQGITQEGFKSALRDELLCEKVLDSISQDIPQLEKQQALDYYQKNRLNFSRAKTWKVSQILITINDEFQENSRDNAKQRIEEVFTKAKSESFADLALRYSECPSALESGQLGWCEEGKLFPQISEALYQIKEGEISSPIETEAGFHLVVWHEEKPPYVASFEEVWPYLEEKHTSRAKAYIQRQWLSQLTS